jgi:hypothetical protein
METMSGMYRHEMMIGLEYEIIKIAGYQIRHKVWHQYDMRITWRPGTFREGRNGRDMTRSDARVPYSAYR